MTAVEFCSHRMLELEDCLRKLGPLSDETFQQQTCKHLTAWNRILLEEKTVAKIVKKFHASFEIRRFIILFTRTQAYTMQIKH
jgi:hypothetical protein